LHTLEKINNNLKLLLGYPESRTTNLKNTSKENIPMESLTKNNFDEKVLKSKKMVLVDFFGKNCEPCKKLAPVMEKIHEDFKEKDYMDVFQVDMNGNDEIFRKFNVMTIPHIIIFNEGKVIDELFGFKDEDVILNFIKKNIKLIDAPNYFVE
jgi:thioredoxin 1